MEELKLDLLLEIQFYLEILCLNMITMKNYINRSWKTEFYLKECSEATEHNGKNLDNY